MIKKLIKTIDILALLAFGMPFAFMVLSAIAVSALCGKRRPVNGRRNKLSFAVFDLISNKYGSMFEDALLNGYFTRHYYIYFDFNNGNDRSENIQDKIIFYSIAAHPYSSLYRAGFSKVNMFVQELKALGRAFMIAYKDGLDIVKAHDPHLLGLNGLIIARIFRLPCVLHMNSDFDMKYLGTGRISSPILISRGVERLFESTVMGLYDLIVADREFYGKSRNFPRSCAKKYKAFGVRVDGSHYTDPGSRQDLKETLGLGGSKIVLYVGRLHPVKYPEDAVKAFCLIKKEVQNAAMLIVGAGTLKGSLERLAENEGIGSSVHFMGQMSYERLIDVLYTADILLAPHGGMTLVEAALASTPVVAYDFDWHSEFIRDGDTGYLVPFRDYKGMAEKAVRILKDETLMGNMSARCRETASSRCSREASVENEKKLYGELMKI
jgi:glycosyltransferase involved in cell wall biosynthesis